MNFKSALLLGIFILGNSAWAESDAQRAFVCQKNIKTEELKSKLEHVQRAYDQVASIRALFEQDSYLAALETQEISNGTVLYKRPGKMQWEYQSPEPQTFTLRDKTVWLYQPEVQQVVIDNVNEVLLSDLPVSFLMGLGKLSSDFKIASGCRTTGGTAIELEPKRSSSPRKNELKSFRLLVGDKSNFPIGAKVTDVAGNVTTVLFKAVNENEPVDDKRFVAQYPAGTDVNDRRKN